MSDPVYEVTSVTLSAKGNLLTIEASGTTDTAGWSNPRLEARIYLEPPPNGLYEFDFM